MYIFYRVKHYLLNAYEALFAAYKNSNFTFNSTSLKALE